MVGALKAASSNCYHESRMKFFKLTLATIALLTCFVFPAHTLTPAEVNSLRARALDHFYNLEYDQAIPLFEQLRDAEPQRAEWHNQVAMSYFYELLHRAGVLQGDLFGASLLETSENV